MDKSLQAALNDRFAYVFLRDPLEDRIREFLLSPERKSYCHAPGCEWREVELDAFQAQVRHCVRCERYQVRSASGAGSWHDVNRRDYEFLVLRDESHRARWDAPHEAVGAGDPDPQLRARPSSYGTSGEVVATTAATAAIASQSDFDTAPRR